MLPWVEKYRPKTLDDIIGQDNVKEMLKKALITKNVPHLLFHGPPGTGKTSSILAFANDLYGSDYRSYILELNASDERGIDVVRNKIVNFAKQTTNHSFKLIILDEADSMTNDAQNALKRIIEKYSDTTRFCLICNYFNKIIDAIKSRTVIFKFRPINLESRIDYIIKCEFFENKKCEKKNIEITEEAKKEIIKISNGDLRNLIILLQNCSCICNGIITIEDVNQVSGIIPKDILHNETYYEGYSVNMYLDNFFEQNHQNHQNHKIMELSDIDKALEEGVDEKLLLMKLERLFY